MALALIAGVCGAAAWLVARSEAPQQALSLGVLAGRGTEVVQGLDRVGKTLTRVPVAQEVEIGRALAREVEAHYPEPGAADAADLGRRQRFVAAVLAALVGGGDLRRPEIPYRVRVLDTGEANAYALPGGNVYITTSLLDLLESEAEVAAILGHEVAHVDLGHCIEAIQTRVHAERLGGLPLGELAALAEALWRTGFDAEQEAEADRRGVVHAASAGYDPAAGPAALRRLERLDAAPAGRRDRLEREIEGMIDDALDDYFRTHPRFPQRIARLELALREQRFDDGRSYYVGRENRRRWIPRSERELPGELVSRTARSAAAGAPAP